MEKRRYGHGGDIYRNKVTCDFSVNVNPLGMPVSVKKELIKKMDRFQNYPDASCRELRESLGGKEGISPEWILCGNGASELFQLIVRAVKPRKAMVTAPTFSGYEYALRAAGIVPDYYYLKEEEGFPVTEELTDQLTPEHDLLFICNPGNPTGKRIDKEVLLHIASYCEKRKVFLVVDECFLGFLEEYEQLSMKQELENPYLIVVNAFTKLYGMAGLRLGYCVTQNRHLMDKMELQQTEWSVSVPAQIAGIQALQEKEYVIHTRQLILEERKKLSDWFRNIGIQVFESSANFLLLKSQQPLYQELLQRGILIRSCSNFKGLSDEFYRIAVKTEAENEILRKLIKEIF